VSIRVATDYRLDGGGVGVRVLVGSRIFCSSCGTNPAFYPMGNGTVYPG
jgi:hypothetical protein